VPYWFPKGRVAPQSGQVQTMLLHVMPQRFSSMQVWQIENPQAQLQQKRKFPPQQLQVNSVLLSFFSRLLPLNGMLTAKLASKRLPSHALGRRLPGAIL